MELSLSHTLHLFNIFREYDGKDNCAQVLEEEIYKMFGTKYLNDEHDCNVVSMNSLNIHHANDMQSHNLGEAMFDEYDIFCPPSFDEQIYYDESMCRCQNRRISGRGSRTVRLGLMVTGGEGHEVLPRFGPPRWR